VSVAAYAEARALAGELRDAGRDDLAARLETVIEEGFSATEILMGLRHVLNQAVSQLPADSLLRDRAESLLGAIQRALSP